MRAGGFIPPVATVVKTTLTAEDTGNGHLAPGLPGGGMEISQPLRRNRASRGLWGGPGTGGRRRPPFDSSCPVRYGFQSN